MNEPVKASTVAVQIEIKRDASGTSIAMKETGVPTGHIQSIYREHLVGAVRKGLAEGRAEVIAQGYSKGDLVMGDATTVGKIEATTVSDTVVKLSLQDAAREMERRFPGRGFVFFVFPVEAGQRAQYVSNADRGRVILAMQELIGAGLPGIPSAPSKN